MSQVQWEWNISSTKSIDRAGLWGKPSVRLLRSALYLLAFPDILPGLNILQRSSRWLHSHPPSQSQVPYRKKFGLGPISVHWDLYVYITLGSQGCSYQGRGPTILGSPPVLSDQTIWLKGRGEACDNVMSRASRQLNSPMYGTIASVYRQGCCDIALHF